MKNGYLEKETIEPSTCPNGDCPCFHRVNTADITGSTGP